MFLPLVSQISSANIYPSSPTGDILLFFNFCKRLLTYLNVLGSGNEFRGIIFRYSSSN